MGNATCHLPQRPEIIIFNKSFMQGQLFFFSPDPLRNIPDGADTGRSALESDGMNVGLKRKLCPVFSFPSNFTTPEKIFLNILIDSPQGAWSKNFL